MSSITPTRDTAIELFKKYNKSESLMKHALSVEGVMRYMAKKHGEDENKWGIIGLIHDLDYEMYPDQHCKMTEKILKENNWPEELAGLAADAHEAVGDALAGEEVGEGAVVGTAEDAGCGGHGHNDIH